MQEYPYEEAIEVLENSLGNAKERLVSEPLVLAGPCRRVCCILACTVPGEEGKQTDDRLPILSSLPLSRQRATNEDLTHLKNQTITVEVNMARLFNWNVQTQKKLASAQGGGGGSGSGGPKRPTFTEKEVSRSSRKETNV